MRRFLENPDGVLICEDECFVGMEARAVVYCVDEFYGNDKNIRCHLMRATDELTIIYVFDKDSFGYLDFGAAILPIFPQCKNVMENIAWQCETCSDNIIICKSCYIGCHNGHTVKDIDIQYDLRKKNVKCECGLKSSNCIFKVVLPNYEYSPV